MKLIAVAGMPASGKGEFSRIAREMGIPVVELGEIVRQEVARAGLELNDHNAGFIATRLRSESGMDAIAARAIPEIRRQDAGIVLVDGIRGDMEVETLRAEFPDFTLVAIDSPFDIRLMRLSGRGRDDDDITTPSKLRRRDEREMGFGLARALEGAEIRVPNTGSLDTFRKAAREVLENLAAEAGVRL